MFNSIWSSAGLYTIVAGLVAGLCSIVSGLVLVVFSCIWSSACLCSIVSGLVLVCIQ